MREVRERSRGGGEVLPVLRGTGYRANEVLIGGKYGWENYLERLDFQRGALTYV